MVNGQLESPHQRSVHFRANNKKPMSSCFQKLRRCPFPLLPPGPQPQPEKHHLQENAKRIGEVAYDGEAEHGQGEAIGGLAPKLQIPQSLRATAGQSGCAQARGVLTFFTIWGIREVR